MWCDSQFSAFNDLLKLDATRRGRIDSAVVAFSGFCDSDPQLNAASAGRPFLQGSVATKYVRLKAMNSTWMLFIRSI